MGAAAFCVWARAGDLTFDGGTFKVVIRPTSAYTVYRMEYEGYLFVDPAVGSCQGTILRMGSASVQQWAGSCHGNETVTSVRAWVDGREQAVSPGAVYSGDRFKLEKTSILEVAGRQVALWAVTQFSRWCIVECVELTVRTDDLWITTFYPWASTHANGLVQYFGHYLSGGTFEGVTDRDDNSTTVIPAVERIAQYDQAAAQGLITCFHRQATVDNALIWDRPMDNKLYWHYRDFQNPIPAGATWRFKTVRQPFAAAPPEWHIAVSGAACSCHHCPGDLNCDGRVDFGDINPFVLALSDWSAWLHQYPDCPPENADVNDDGEYGGLGGFGDINPFVGLLVSGQGQPLLCP